MSSLNLTDNLNAICDVVCEAKSVADIISKYIEDTNFNLLKDNKLQLIYAVDAISRILAIANIDLTKLSKHYAYETDDKFASILIN